MNRLSVTDLQAVVAVARTGRFRAAALELGMSTSALSAAIGRIEGSLGLRLFNRTTRSVAPTDGGRAFIARIGPALLDIDAGIEAARSRQAVPTGTLRINAFASAAREIISPLVLEFLRRHPGTHVDLVTEGRLVDIVAEGFDFGLRRADLVPADMIALEFGSPQRHAVVCAPAYAEAHGRPCLPADLSAHACIRARLPDGRLLRWRFAREGETVLVDVSGPLTLDDADLARLAVLQGTGIGFFMEQDVRAEIAAGRMLRLLEDWTPPLAPLALYYPGRRNPSAAHRAFVALARELAPRRG